MRKFLSLTVVAISVITLFVIHSCKKDTGDGIVEPITINKPDSLIAYNYAGGTQKINISFTTDRPINKVTGMYQVDTIEHPAAWYTYPDTLFYVILDTIPSKLSNKYTYSGTYHIPDSLPVLSVIRFDIKMKASGNPSSPDTVREEKQFKIVLQ
ncbi:MAG: hypothetical protein JWO03_2325 [Bacteroidetes bacterium]|nr:hypothetical protein [Bacteroidota bacterium]